MSCPGSAWGKSALVGLAALVALSCERVRSVWVHPPHDISLLEALHGASLEARVAALEQWRAARHGELPDDVTHWVTDTNPQLRRAALAALTNNRHPRAAELVLTALDDPDVDVRTAAIAAIAEIGGTEAATRLDELLDSPAEKIRVATVAALGKLHEFETLRRAANDKAWQVRAAVAAALADDPRGAALALAEQLAADRSAEVQKQIVAAVEKWPLDAAIPVLLTVAGTNTFLPSKLAAEQLTRRWEPARNLPIEPPQGKDPHQVAQARQKREAALAELRRRWQTEFEQRVMQRATQEADRAAATVRVPLEKIRHVQRLLDNAAEAARSLEAERQLLDQLAAEGQDLPAILDELVRDGRYVPPPEAVFLELLPRCSPAFAALADLASSDVIVRRRAAGRLVELGKQRGLSPAVVERLATVAVAERDPIVWQHVLTGVAGDTGDAAARLALAALSHPAAEVRRHGCQWLGQRRDPRHAAALLAALDDPQTAVVIAAVQALAEVGNVEDPGRLGRLLASPDPALRLEAATTLARMNVAQGRDGLVRLTHDPDPRIRRQAKERLSLFDQ